MNRICEESKRAFGDRRIYSQTAAGQGAPCMLKLTASLIESVHRQAINTAYKGSMKSDIPQQAVARHTYIMSIRT